MPGEKASTPTAVTIGNFYAVHRGHQSLIAKVRKRAAELDALPTVLTFEPHPQKILRGVAPPGLVTAEEKVRLLEELGIEQVVILEFTEDLSKVEPEDFIEEILVRQLGVRAVVVGQDFKFGRYARGDVTMLRTFGARLNFVFDEASMTEMQGRRVSSTAIRHALSEGDVRWAAAALGRPYRLPGEVVHGSGRGKVLGYPTANLNPSESVCLPGEGIYAGYSYVDGKALPSAISVGTNPTFGDNPLSVEAFVLDYDGDLYGRQIEFEFVERIRDHVAFSGPEELHDAIKADVAEVRRLL
ncbi:MAG: bifunctional riboflavin kinase/FAD synthetase [Actinomycetota bacterium]